MIYSPAIFEVFVFFEEEMRGRGREWQRPRERWQRQREMAEAEREMAETERWQTENDRG